MKRLVESRMPREPLPKPVIYGRSSSHFTRVVRIFAAELRLEYSFQVVFDLLSENLEDYAGNPALRVPTLVDRNGSWFGALNICRELARVSLDPRRVVWPEELREPLQANAQELVLQAMATEVSVIMARIAAHSQPVVPSKAWHSLTNTMSWLENNVEAALGALPADRYLSFLETSLFCLVTHLEFREVLPISPYPKLVSFCARFGERASAVETAFRFDP